MDWAQLLKWRFDGDDHFTYMVDERLCFGARKSPSIFTQLTQAVIRILANIGHSGIVCYVDDFLIVAETHAECLETMSVLQKTLRALGFHINYKKIEGPSHHMNFLGVLLDSRNMMIELPEEKIIELKRILSNLITKDKITKRQLQSLVGKLNWSSMCLWGDVCLFADCWIAFVI